MAKIMNPEKYITAMYGERLFDTNDNKVNKELMFELMETYAQYVKDQLTTKAIEKIQEIWK